VFTANTFTPLTDFVSTEVLQGYIVLMALAVVIGTLFDLLHDKKLTFFLQERQRTRAAAKQPLSGADWAAIATRTLVTDIATFGEFCNPQRRISHVLMFYGFVLYLVTSVVMVFVYPTDTHPPLVLPILWNIGVLLTLVGGYWFFFLLRVNVTHDGHPPWRLVRADLFYRDAARQRHVRTAVRSGGDGGQRNGDPGMRRPLRLLHDAAVCFDSLVQVCPYVLQASGGVPETGGGGGRFVQPANADSTKR